LDHETHSSKALRAILVARGLRAFGDGYISLLLPVYLLSLGYTAFDVGVIATATLLGSGALTLALGLTAHRFRTRTLLLAAAALMAATGVSFATVSGFWPIVVVAIVGTLNRRAATSACFFHRATLPRPRRAAPDGVVRARLVGAAAGGAVCANLPQWLASAGVPSATALRCSSYALISASCAIVYRRLPSPHRCDFATRTASSQRGSCSRSRRSSASTRLQEVSSSSRCSRCGCSSASRCRSLRRA
jgi:hypothetical protein